jgi:LysR family transcriptional regulator, benzoate and cis,cis-muconate-responsive activator of ben and cat genes
MLVQYLKCSIDIFLLSMRHLTVIHLLSMTQIQTFLMVAETLNFRRAAERLAVAQPALSRSVRRLE